MGGDVQRGWMVCRMVGWVVFTPALTAGWPLPFRAGAMGAVRMGVVVEVASCRLTREGVGVSPMLLVWARKPGKLINAAWL